MRLWIARWENGNLTAFYREPFKNADGFYIRSRYQLDESISWCSHNTGGEYLNLDSNLFPEVTFENSPLEVVLELSGEKKFTEEELSNPVLPNMTWRVDTPALLKEVANCSNQGIYSPVMAIFGRLLACVADRASQLNDPILNICMLKLKMYEVPHHEIQMRIEEQLKRINNGKFTKH